MRLRFNEEKETAMIIEYKNPAMLRFGNVDHADVAEADY